MRRITQLFVNRPPLVFVLVSVITLAGSLALATLVQQQFPNIDFPTINVSVAYPGASPSELRDSVVRPIEDAIAGAPDLDHINTSIQQNQASISATFTLDSNQTTDLTEVQNRVQTAQAALPADLPAPSVRTFDPAQITVVTLAVTSQSLSSSGLSAIVTNNIVPALEQVSGVSSVGANGTVTPALEVTLDPAKLSSAGFVPTDVVSAIQSNNVRAPGGIAYLGNRETSIDVRGDVQTPASIENLLLSGSTSVLLGATSPSGTASQKYTGTSGSTNQALSLSSSALASASGSSGSAAGGAGTSGAASGTTASGTAVSGASSSGTASSAASTSTSGTATSGNAASSGALSSGGSAANGSTAVQLTSALPITPAAANTPAPAATLSPATAQALGAAHPIALGTAAASTLASGTAATPSPGPSFPALTVPANAGSLAASTLASSNAVAASSTASLPFTANNVSTSGAASSGAAAQSLNPFSATSRLPRISDVATVTDWYEPKRVYSYVDGKLAISLNVQKANGASEVQSSEAVLAALPAIEAQYPDIKFQILNVQADQTKAQLWGVLETLIEGIVFTGIAMLVFLRSWRNALVVMVAIPMSLFVTLFAMKLVGFTVDTISLLAMTLIIGILVDDSIVVLENVERHYEDGEAPRTAAILGRAEIGVAAIVITLVDVVVFLPIAFLPGQTGRFLAEFGVVVTIATLTSLAVSFTITPSLAGNWSLLSNWRAPRFIEAFTRGFARLREFYSGRLLARAMRHPWLVCGVSAVLTLVAIALVWPLGVIGFEFIPAVDAGQIFVQVQYPTGTPLTKTDAAVRTLTAAFLQMDGVQQIVSTTGTSQAGFGGAINLGSNGQLRVLLAANHKRTTDQIARTMNGMARGLVPDAKIVAIPATGTRGGNSQPIDATVATTRGEPDAYAAQVLGALEDTSGATNVNSSSLNLAPQIDIEFDRDRARALDLDIGLAAQAVRAAFGGTLATQFDTVNGTKYVQVLYPQSDQTSLTMLRQITLRNRSGQIVRLGDVAVLKNNPAQALITRVNRQTVIHIGANLAPGYALSTVQRNFLERIRALHLPSTVIVGTGAGGSQQSTAQTASGLGVSLVLSFFLVYLLMVALYNGYRAPLVIMFAVPVAAIGAFGALAITGQTLNLFSLIGVVMLVGLVSKNGILLVDFATMKVMEGVDKRSAIVAAARERFRPIIMTTVSMISGMLPLALALDPGSAAKRSLGTVVIGGLTSSLLLTLVLVPVVYLWIAPPPPAQGPAPEDGHDKAMPLELARDSR